MMFLGTHTGDQPWDIVTRADEIVDGASTTLLIGENTLAGYSKGNRYSGGNATNWACPLPNFCMFIGSDDICRTANSPTSCLGGQLRPVRTPTGIEPGAGWTRANHPKSYERINYGQNLTVNGSFPFVTSGHPGGANFVFCDGSTRFIRESIDGRVYANLITPSGLDLPGPIRQIGEPVSGLEKLQ
jgi:prepilin-type processing-associated H-X9-DG protein